ncbi:uncharacterized protein [Magallana gigas]|uniref:uncharacterized protein n=1 Tax=Magallana gigas TaxID=29159 RepID=UPI003341232F
MTCDRETGVCIGGCLEGWKPPMCNERCDDGTFGTNCSSTCGHCHKGKPCDKKTGACPKECDPGYEGLYCNKTCARTNYGPNCNLTCSTYCFNQACDSRNGACLTNIEEIIEGTSTAIGVTIGVFLVIAIITVVAIIYKRNNITICRCITPGRSASKGSNTSSENTSHMPKTYMDLKKSQYNEIDENVYEKIKKELPMENRNVYEQFLADILLNDIGSVKIDKGNDNSDRLKKDLASLPRGEHFPCDTGKLSMSSEKNRVQSILPYDLSKMIFSREVGTSDDYVNVKCGAERKN